MLRGARKLERRSQQFVELKSSKLKSENRNESREKSSNSSSNKRDRLPVGVQKDSSPHAKLSRESWMLGDFETVIPTLRSNERSTVPAASSHRDSNVAVPTSLSNVADNISSSGRLHSRGRVPNISIRDPPTSLVSAARSIGIVDEESEKQAAFQANRRLNRIIRSDCGAQIDEIDDAISFDSLHGSHSKRRLTGKQQLEALRKARLSKTEERLCKVADSTRCLFCGSNPDFAAIRGSSLISLSSQIYLAFQTFKQCVTQYQLFLSPVEHTPSVTQFDESQYEELRNFQKSLVACADECNMGVIFSECYSRNTTVERTLLGGGLHSVVDCWFLPLDRLEESKAYFKNALFESAPEWGEHKKVIPFHGRGSWRSALPQQLTYFAVDFNLGGGFLQVIETDDFNRRLGRDVIKGMHELDAVSNFYHDRRSYLEGLKEFKAMFRRFDWVRYSVPSSQYIQPRQESLRGKQNSAS